MVEPACAQFEKWRQANNPVMLVQQAYCGANKSLQARSDQGAWKLSFGFENSARDIPQQNHLAALDLTTNAARAWQ